MLYSTPDCGPTGLRIITFSSHFHLSAWTSGKQQRLLIISRHGESNAIELNFNQTQSNSIHGFVQQSSKIELTQTVVQSNSCSL